MAGEIRGLVNSDGTEFLDARTLDEFNPTSGTLSISGNLTVSGDVSFDGPVLSNINTISAGYTTTINDSVILCDVGDYTITLHDPTTANKQEMTINNISTSNISISGSIQQLTNPTMVPNDIYNIISNGTKWYWRS